MAARGLREGFNWGERGHGRSGSFRASALGLLLSLLAMLLILGVILYPATSAAPPTTAPLLRVATRVLPPFVIQTDRGLSGFSIQLWNRMAQELGMKSQYKIYPSVSELLGAIATGKADLGIAAISITAEREQQFDFSHPVLEGGLQIMVRNTERTGTLSHLLRMLFSGTLGRLIVLALILVLIAAHVIWIFERDHPDDMISNDYFPGIFQACWWAASTLATQADQMPKGPFAQMVAVLWMFTGVVFVAYFTATVTTSMTVQQLQTNIRDINDLSGRVVATTVNSTAANFLRQQNIKLLEVNRIEDAYAALMTNRADAIVFDAPVLLYYAANQGKGQVQTLSPVLREENYGIALPKESRYRKPINATLLKLKESGAYEALYNQWFKQRSSSRD